MKVVDEAGPILLYSCKNSDTLTLLMTSIKRSKAMLYRTWVYVILKNVGLLKLQIKIVNALRSRLSIYSILSTNHR